MIRPMVYVLAHFPSGEMIEWREIPISKLSLLLRILLKRGATNVITKPIK